MIRWGIEHQQEVTDRRALHFGALLATFPFFGSIAAAIGRQIHLDGAADRKSLRAFARATFGEREFIDDPEADNRPVRFNDGSADRQGRFWCGSTQADDQFQKLGSLYRLDAARRVKMMAGGLACSNGLGWSPDNRTMYVTAQFAYELEAFDFDPATGEIANRRSFAKVPEADGLPDGLTVDAEGCVWSAQWGGWRLTRYDPAGKVERVLKMPVPNPTSCCFGGPGLKDLYVTTAWLMLTDEERKAAPGSGDLWVVHTDIRGIAEPKYAG